jgi:adenylate cyclase
MSDEMNSISPLNFLKKIIHGMKIRTKLITIISIIIVTSLSGMILLATYFFRADNEIRVQESNLKIAEVISLKMQGDFASIAEKLNLMATTMQQQFVSINQKNLFTDLFFANDKNLVYVGVADAGSGNNCINFLHSRVFFTENSLTIDDVNRINREHAKAFVPAYNNDAVIKNVSSNFKSPMVAVALPFQKNHEGSAVNIIISYIKLDRFLQSFKASEGDIIETFMVNDQGEVIAHPDSKIVLSHGNYFNQPIVQRMLKSKIDNGLSRYKNADGDWHLGSFKKIGIAGLGIIATVSEEKALAAVYKIQRRNIYITVIVLNIAILIVYFFGKTITNPIISLLRATKEIEQGNFCINILPKSGDEIGQLTNSFVAMGRGLEERERMKEAFGKFVNKEIAERVLRGEVKLGGERKTATVFFSDIRSFTSISEKLEPEEVVEFLNQYMTRMVQCVNLTNGVVDKFIGDAVMAVWGAPVSYGNDCRNAINGALLMRYELLLFNRGRGSEKKPIIRIGCGINTGPVLAGQIGSEERMEYTVIGDTVNLASRIESLNKPFGTDILISEDTYFLVKDIYRVEPMQKIKVKGKSEPQQIYAVLGPFEDPETPQTLEDLRKMIGSEVTGKPEISDEAEVKYEIIGEDKKSK